MKFTVKSNILLLGILIGLTILVIYFTNHYILTVDFYKNSDELNSDNPGSEVDVFEKLQKWIYICSIFYLLLKLGTISLILYTALYMREVEVSFQKLMGVVTLAEFIFLIPAAIKAFWFYYAYPDGRISDWFQLYILSASSLFNGAPADWHYMLETLNAFEVAYWFILAYGLFKITRLDYDNSLKIVIISYVPALAIWVSAVTFCSLLAYSSGG